MGAEFHALQLLPDSPELAGYPGDGSRDRRSCLELGRGRSPVRLEVVLQKLRNANGIAVLLGFSGIVLGVLGMGTESVWVGAFWILLGIMWILIGIFGKWPENPN